jgi:hypothetical protein
VRPNRHARRDNPKDLTTTTAQDPAPLLRWHYGPTALDSDPRKMWHTNCGREVQIIDGGHVCVSCDTQQPPADEEPTDHSPASLADIAAMLERTTTNLASFIETRAAQIAQPAIDEHKATTDQTIDDLEHTLTANRERADELQAEMHRQMRVLEEQKLRAGYAARHLPDHIKAAAGLQWVDRIPESDLEQLGADWTARIDHVTESQLRAHAGAVIAELNARLRARNAPEKHAVVLTAGPPDILWPADELPDPGSDQDLMLEAAPPSSPHSAATRT